ncbi:MAG: hypothetical protein IH973_05665, partial [Myxococcales bacterium]|nr:hypothetical protein [Myxococcales bacterium]
MRDCNFKREGGVRSRGGKSSPRLAEHLRVRNGPWKRRVAWLTLFSFFVSPASMSFAGESTATAIGNATTQDGAFTENTQTHTTFEQDTSRAVIHWDVMDQQADNTLTFIQNQGDSVLNQAQGISPSVFRGRIDCESCVFANEAGVTFADGSYIDVARLVTIAGNVSVQDFRAGDLHAENINGEVHNFGQIHADSALLIGARITNGGEIYIADGTLTAVVGEEVWLREHDSNVVIHAQLPQQDADPNRLSDAGEFDELPAIDNSGTIDAGTGSVRLLAGDMLSFAIRNQGRIRAREIRLEAGEGSLVEVSGGGILDAGNSQVGGVGGTIAVLGDYVAIADEAVLDASGHSGGGEILVGGDRGGAAGTRTSKSTYVGKHTLLRADATHSGDGGKIIVWSDGGTRSYGTISALGGVDSGNGGFVETSGLEHLDVLSSPLIYARSGNADDRGGEWLLDPFNIDIVAICTTTCLDDDLIEDGSYDPDLVFTTTVFGSSNPSEIQVDLLKEVLLSGANVTITTQGEGSDAGDEVGNINFKADLIFSGGALFDTHASLSLFAAGDITINNTISNNDSNLTLDLDFRANDSGQPELEDDTINYALLGDLTIDALIETGGGSVLLSGINVNLNATGTIDTDGGNIDLFGADVSVAGTLDSGGGDVFVQAVRTLTVSDDGSSFSEAGGKVSVVGYFVTYPAEKINGVMVSYKSPQKQPDADYPAAALVPIREQLDSIFGEEKKTLWSRFLPWDFDPANPPAENDPAAEAFRMVSGRVERRILSAEYNRRAALYLAQSPYDLFISYFGMVDSSSHSLWKFMDDADFELKASPESKRLLGNV